ncbi:MAG: antibiotic biosynthesis monooxygenase [Chloroflexia bacterium]|nr:antibiotic biosynthesis monooxygenase [Chloroflexia bacterium]
MANVTVALFVRMDAKPGKEAEAAAFLKSALPLVNDEPDTVAWFGIQIGPSTFAIFDAFPTEAGRDAHLSGKVAAALMEQAPDLFTGAPVIEQAEVLASKLPG